jgi:hypothetical protein
MSDSSFCFSLSCRMNSSPHSRRVRRSQRGFPALAPYFFTFHKFWKAIWEVRKYGTCVRHPVASFADDHKPEPFFLLLLLTRHTLESQDHSVCYPLSLTVPLFWTRPLDSSWYISSGFITRTLGWVNVVWRMYSWWRCCHYKLENRGNAVSVSLEN